MEGRCGAECGDDNDCDDNSCIEIYQDGCVGNKLREYNGNHIIDFTLVSDFCENTCEGDCACTDCEVECLEPEATTSCVEGICNAECDSDDDCDDQNPNTIDTCNLDSCGCEHEELPFCGNRLIDFGEDCELPSTSNNLYCDQVPEQCIGTKLGQRDSYGDCDASCGCDFDEFNYQCVEGRCGATCDSHDDCDDRNPNTIDTCNLDTCSCEYEYIPYCGDGIVQLGESCEYPSTSDNLYCLQSTSDCLGNKLGTRDAFGDCDRACGCQFDNFNYECVVGVCGATCIDGESESQQCGLTDVGECEYGEQWRTCTGECIWGDWGQCRGDVGPTDEICDGLDNDCDGEIDEDIDPIPCGSGDCTGIIECIDGSWTDCSSYEEDCGICALCDITGECTIYDETQDDDCADITCIDDCDLDPDNKPFTWDFADDVQNYCTGLFTCTQNVCEYQHECSYGCGAECLEGEFETLECGPEIEVGECQRGEMTRTCTDDCVWGEWSECIGAVYPTEEICDGLDNDCDGKSDEGIWLQCGLDVPVTNSCPQILLDEDGQIIDYFVHTWMGTDEDFWMGYDDFLDIAYAAGWAGRSYAFDGELIAFEFLAQDMDGIADDCVQGYVTLDDGYDPRVVQCTKELINTTTAVFTCAYYVEDAQTRSGEYWVSVEVSDQCGEGCVDKGAGMLSLYLNPEASFTIQTQGDRPLEFAYDVSGDLLARVENGQIVYGPSAGETAYTPYFIVENSADPDSGLYMLIKLYGTDFTAEPDSGVICPTSNVLDIGNAYYEARHLNVEQGWTQVPDGTNYGEIAADYVFRNWNIGDPDFNGAANFLGVGDDLTMRLKLNVPSPCTGQFTGGGEIIFVSEVI